ncbi:hypothetical protein OB2597_03012 [Pseudooceanicola batsensis HTCC2597]|uniref:Uncharacterized protein n=1 Tax=Pseudooceanicola batsensis (strain ATCC BAA-863 / DSM 15984 / KCTC 12145 / HTCC2597) TaxID=252305 RepID=A3TXJ6_PSEBH|nr:DUF6477 family protein [Pseudooceanicola batsensis]EAQ03556.1 hypothetical protein OB2597_03012 [Pseudooceanicola batsensis HTCC2597]
MQDAATRLAALRRPRIMIEAARRGAARYDRDRHLVRILGRVPRRGAAMVQLLELEAGMEAARRSDPGVYRPAPHLAALIALLGEARLPREGAEVT